MSLFPEPQIRVRIMHQKRSYFLSCHGSAMIQHVLDELRGMLPIDVLGKELGIAGAISHANSWNALPSDIALANVADDHQSFCGVLVFREKDRWCDPDVTLPDWPRTPECAPVLPQTLMEYVNSFKPTRAS